MDRLRGALARIGMLAAPLLALVAPQAQASAPGPAPIQASGEDFASLNAGFRRALADAPSTPAGSTGLRSALLATGAPPPAAAPPGELVLASAMDAQRTTHHMDSTLHRMFVRHRRHHPHHHPRH